MVYGSLSLWHLSMKMEMCLEHECIIYMNEKQEIYKNENVCLLLLLHVLVEDLNADP